MLIFRGFAAEYIKVTRWEIEGRGETDKIQGKREVVVKGLYLLTLRVSNTR